MSKIDDLLSLPIEVNFKDEKITLKSGFTLEETPAIQMAFGNKNIEVQSKGLQLLLKIIAKRIYPNATDEQISNIDAKHTHDLLDVFFQLDKSTDTEKERIKKLLEKNK